MTDNSSLLPGLYLVATPIGNLGDFSLRAIETLKDVDVIACEDTRTSSRLLSHYGIKKPLISYHDHNSQDMAPRIAERIREGQRVALVSDAGAPLVSDPGYKLVSLCRKLGLHVTAVPGAVAFITALQISGFSPQTFSFCGFLPNRQKARREALAAAGERPDTVIFYESPNRLLEALSDVREVLGDIRVCVARELTKKFEEVTTDTVSRVMAHYEAKEAIKGEIVLLLEIPERRREFSDEDIAARLRELMADMSKKDAVAEAAQEFSLPRKRVYDLAVKL